MRRLLLISFLVALSNLASLSAQWSMVHPIFRGEPSSIDFADDSIGIIIDAFGVHRTTDGGRTWAYTVLDRFIQAWKIRFVNRSRAFILGYGGAVLRSDDAGVTWNPATIGGEVDVILKRLDFDEKGWGYAIDHADHVQRAINGGDDWADVTPHVLLRERVGYENFMLYGIEAVDSLTALIHGEHWESYGGHSDHFLLRTTDAGTSWDSIRLPDTLRRPGGWRVDAFHFWSGDSGVVVMGSIGKIHVTYDGGRTWSAETGEKEIGMVVTHFEQSSNGKIFGFRSSQYFARNAPMIVESSDRGRTWRQNNTHITSGAAAFATTPGRTYAVHDVSFLPSGDVAYTVGSGGQIFRTRDGGKRWVCWSRPHFYCVDMVDDSVGYAAGEGLFRTTDGGLSWEDVGFDTIVNYTVITFIDRDTGYLFDGHRQYLYKTTDGGRSRRRIAADVFDKTLDRNALVNDLTFFTPSIGLACTPRAVYATNDYGETWTKRPYPFETVSPASLPGFYATFDSTGRGYKVGRDGTPWYAFRTDDSGRTWGREGIVPLANAVWFADDRFGVAGPTVQYTINRGADWITPVDEWGDTIELSDFWHIEQAGDDQFYFVGGDQRFHWLTRGARSLETYSIRPPSKNFGRYFAGKFSGISFASPSAGIAVGSFGTISRYSCAAPTASFGVSLDTGGVVRLVNLSTGGDSCLWDYGDGSPIDTTWDPLGRSHTYRRAGTFRITLVVLNCGQRDTFALSVVPEGVTTSSVRAESHMSHPVIITRHEGTRVEYRAEAAVMRCDLYDVMGRRLCAAEIVSYGQSRSQGILRIACDRFPSYRFLLFELVDKRRVIVPIAPTAP